MKKRNRISIWYGKCLQASMTVEAAYVIPLVLAVIFAIMTMSYYFYDINTAQAICDQKSVQLSNLPLHPYQNDGYFFDYGAVNERFFISFLENYEKIEKQERECIKESLEKRLFFLRLQTVDVKIEKNSIDISAELGFRHITYGFQFLPFLQNTLQITTKQRIYHPADFVRMLSVSKK